MDFLRLLPYMDDPNEQVFSHRDTVDGTVRHFAVSRMLAWIAETKLAPIPTMIDYRHAQFLLRGRDLENHRLKALVDNPAWRNIPILMLDMPCGTTLTADGNHRYYVKAMSGDLVIMAYRLRQEQWEPFVLTNIPPKLERMLVSTLPAVG